MRAAEIVGRLEVAVGVEGAPRSLKGAIETILIDSGLSPLSALELAEKRVAVVQKTVVENIRRGDNGGTVYPLVILGATLDVVAGSSFVLPQDPTIVAEAKAGRSQAEQIYAAVQSLTFPEFEQFGKRYLQEIGAEKARVTRHSNDQGIDFYGQLTLGVLTGMPINMFHASHQIAIILVGQAKHYPKTRIGPDIVRELVGALSLARTKTFSSPGLDLLDDVDLRPFSPCVALLLTTGEFSSGAMALARQAGLLLQSGRQIATFLADKNVGIVQRNGRSVFDRSAFMAWLLA